MKKLMLVLFIIPFAFLFSCQANNTIETAKIHVISAETGKQMLDQDSSIILLDVRTVDEYNDEHIPDAVNFPLDSIEDNAGSFIPDKDATYIVYCRSANRSAMASQILVELGYQNIYDMGGIIDWPYDTVS